MLEGKTALITGSTGGIGLGIAIALARAGANIALNGRADDAHEATAQVAAHGTQVAYFRADMAGPMQIANMMRAAAERFGRIDIVINNAGMQYIAATEDFPEDRWDAMIAVNLSSAFHTTRLALPAMKAANWGRIINIGSTHSLVASPNKSAYVAAKHAIIGLTKAVALENVTSGVTCNAICPGMVLTSMVERQIAAFAAQRGMSHDDATHAFLAAKQPSLQFTTPEQLGALAVFICSPGGDNVRGVAWQVDGGWTAQ
ncbi:3-hydroxybutyrate dehydrogenase [Paraburkholderia sp. RL17-337-BIB-A]|uniref:3-hydroxybutyrate dehydrogenase n=1 Tax=Paraburkholderia sp. RL17-337-BIB-A TaxID=3031636 RepID=UPI0038BC0CAB